MPRRPAFFVRVSVRVSDPEVPRFVRLVMANLWLPLFVVEDLLASLADLGWIVNQFNPRSGDRVVASLKGTRFEYVPIPQGVHWGEWVRMLFHHVRLHGPFRIVEVSTPDASVIVELV